MTKKYYFPKLRIFYQIEGLNREWKGLKEGTEDTATRTQKLAERRWLSNLSVFDDRAVSKSDKVTQSMHDTHITHLTRKTRDSRSTNVTRQARDSTNTAEGLYIFFLNLEQIRMDGAYAIFSFVFEFKNK